MVKSTKVAVDVRFDVTPVEEWPEDQRASLANKLISYVDRELTTDVERALHFVDLAERHELWRFLNKGSMQELLDTCDITAAAIKQYRVAARLLRKGGAAMIIVRTGGDHMIITCPRCFRPTGLALTEFSGDLICHRCMTEVVELQAKIPKGTARRLPLSTPPALPKTKKSLPGQQNLFTQEKPNG